MLTSCFFFKKKNKNENEKSKYEIAIAYMVLNMLFFLLHGTNCHYFIKS